MKTKIKLNTCVHITDETSALSMRKCILRYCSLLTNSNHCRIASLNTNGNWAKSRTIT